VSSEPDIDDFFGPDDSGNVPPSSDVVATDLPVDSHPDDDIFQESLRPKACEPAEWEKRIQTVIQMIGWGEKRGEIKRRCSATWGIKPRSIEPYITAANRRLEAGNETPELDIADALLHWRNRKLEAEWEIQQEKKAIGISEGAITQLKARIAELEAKEELLPKGEPLEILKLQKTNAVKQLNSMLFRIDVARGLIEKATTRSDNAQQHIERIKGVHAPIKYAKTDASGRDIENWTPEEVAERLAKLGFQQLPKRLPAPAVTPSHVPSPATAVEQPIDAEFTVKPSATSKNGHAGNGHANGKSNGHIPPIVNGFGDSHVDL
jgi:hypothetical protein